jgi:hypothetical protein
LLHVIFKTWELRKFILEVNMPQSWKPKSRTAKAVYAAGFLYDPEQDIIYSRMDALQRKFGYAYAYDLAAPASISAIIDCEPFFFSYDGKDWMIELWKGQYGLETGCEIGVYCRKSTDKRPLFDSTLGKRPNDPANSKLFDCANDKERLKMSFTLNRNGKPLFKRGPEVHWWLTGFMWGILSTPEELTIDLSITFPDAEMQRVFVSEIKKANHQNIKINAEEVSFTFNKPNTFQPRLDPKSAESVKLTHKNNSQIVEQYKKLSLSSNDPNQIHDDDADDIVTYFNSFDPKRLREHLAKTVKAEEALEFIFKTNLNFFTKIKADLSKYFKKHFN